MIHTDRMSLAVSRNL